MKYPSGEQAKVGDRIAIGSWSSGIVVCSIDDDEYSTEYPREAWAYLGKGVVVLTEAAGPIYYEEADDDMELLSRGAAT